MGVPTRGRGMRVESVHFWIRVSRRKTRREIEELKQKLDPNALMTSSQESNVKDDSNNMDEYSNDCKQNNSETQKIDPSQSEPEVAFQSVQRKKPRYDIPASTPIDDDCEEYEDGFVAIEQMQPEVTEAVSSQESGLSDPSPDSVISELEPRGIDFDACHAVADAPAESSLVSDTLSVVSPPGLVADCDNIQVREDSNGTSFTEVKSLRSTADAKGKEGSEATPEAETGVEPDTETVDSLITEIDKYLGRERQRKSRCGGYGGEVPKEWYTMDSADRYELIRRVRREFDRLGSLKAVLRDYYKDKHMKMYASLVARIRLDRLGPRACGAIVQKYRVEPLFSK